MDYEKLAIKIGQGVAVTVIKALQEEEVLSHRPKRKKVLRTAKARGEIKRKAVRKPDKPKPRIKVKNVWKIKKIGKKRKKLLYKFIKARLTVNKSVFVTGLIKNVWGEFKRVKGITLGQGNIAWISVDDYRSNKENWMLTKKKVNKFMDDLAQPPKHVYGEYERHSTTFGEGPEINREFKVHPAVLDSELEMLMREGTRNAGDLIGE